MPAGDLLSGDAADWQAELNGVLMGDLTDYKFGELGIEGLGVPAAKSNDTDLVGQDGAYAAPDFMGVRALLIHLTVGATALNAADGFAQLATLNPAWEPVTADVELHLQLPGLGHIKFVGRPRGLEAVATNVLKGEIDLIGDFRAMAPRAVSV